MVFNKSNGFYKSNTTKIVHEDLIDYLCRNFVFKVDLEQLKVSKFLILKQSKMLLLENSSCMASLGVFFATTLSCCISFLTILISFPNLFYTYPDECH